MMLVVIVVVLAAVVKMASSDDRRCLLGIWDPGARNWHLLGELGIS